MSDFPSFLMQYPSLFPLIMYEVGRILKMFGFTLGAEKLVN